MFKFKKAYHEKQPIYRFANRLFSTLDVRSNVANGNSNTQVIV